MQTINTTTNPIVNIPQNWADLDGNINDNEQLVSQINDLINRALYYSDLNSVAKALDLIVGDNGELYIGNPETDGNWMIAKSGANLIIAKRESGAWVTKDTING